MQSMGSEAFVYRICSHLDFHLLDVWPVVCKCTIETDCVYGVVCHMSRVRVQI